MRGASRGRGQRGRDAPGFRGGRKLRGSPKIPQLIRDQIAEEDGVERGARFTSATPTSSKLTSRKLLRKQKKEDKKDRIRAYHNQNKKVPDPPPTVAEKRKRDKASDRSRSPAKKKKKLNPPSDAEEEEVEIEQVNFETPLTRDQEEIAYLEKKLARGKANPKTKSQLDGFLKGISAGGNTVDTTTLKKNEYCSSSEDESDGYAEFFKDSDDEAGDQNRAFSSDDDEPDDGFNDDEDDDRSDLQSDSDEEMSDDDNEDNNKHDNFEEQESKVLTPSQPTPNATPAPGATQKYIPPSLRKKMELEAAKNKPAGSTEEQSTGIISEELRKKIRGLLNRVSELNVSNVESQIQQLFESYSRNSVNSCVSALLLEDCGQGAATQVNIIPVYAALLTLLHYSVGADVGGLFLNQWGVAFHSSWNDEEASTLTVIEEDASKNSTVNLMKMLSHLYCFKLVHCSLLFDLIRALIERFRPIDIELLLVVLRITGSSLRSDDPSALKQIILLLQQQVQAFESGTLASQTGASSSSAASIEDTFGVRIKFMLDTIYDLKNNRKRANASTSAHEQLTKLVAKVQKPSSVDQLRISLSELQLHSTNQYKWWVKGSTLPGMPMAGPGGAGVQARQFTSEQDHLLKLAKQQGMNTDIRRAIFVTLLTADDYLDAFDHLIALKMKGKEDREVANVLVHCCAKEKQYNPYYGFLANKLCTFNYNHRFTMQYNFWDRFKRWNTQQKDIEQTLPTVRNLSCLLAHLIATNALSLSILKVVDFVKLSPLEIVFFKNLFTRLLCDYEPKVIQDVFDRIVNNVKLHTLRDGILAFMSNALRSSSLQSNASLSESDIVKIRAQVRLVKRWFRQAPTDLLF